MKAEKVEVEEILYAIKKRIYTVFIITLISTGIGLLVSIFIMKPVYQGQVKLFITNPNGKVVFQRDQSSNVQVNTILMNTCTNIIQTASLVKNAIEINKFDLKTKNELKNLSVINSGDSRILTIIYKSTNEGEVLPMLNTLTNEFTLKANILIPGIKITKVGTPYIKSNNGVIMKVEPLVIGFVLGIISGIAVILILEFMDNTIKSREELEKALNIQVLGVIPNSQK